MFLSFFWDSGGGQSSTVDEMEESREETVNLANCNPSRH
jgi:hypothetical protein